MRLIVLALLSLGFASGRAAEPASQATPTHPLWNGEPIPEYAKKVGLEPTRTLDLGNGAKMELVLIPAGRFRMGCSAPPYLHTLQVYGIVAIVSAGILAGMVFAILARAWRPGRRVQFSLRTLLLCMLTAAVVLLGLVGIWDSWPRYNEARQHFDESEGPEHEVTISRPFYMSACEVTWEEFDAVMGGTSVSSADRRLPLQGVTWNEGQQFFRKLGDRIGMNARFPSEAEWEYACRAGTENALDPGNGPDLLVDVAWFSKNSKGEAHEVGAKRPNAWGLYDMRGNVEEFCEESSFRQYTAGDVVDPMGDRSGNMRICRGGSFGSGAFGCRASGRWLWTDINDRTLNVGLRMVVDVPSGPPCCGPSVKDKGE